MEGSEEARSEAEGQADRDACLRPSQEVAGPEREGDADHPEGCCTRDRLAPGRGVGRLQKIGRTRPAGARQERAAGDGQGDVQELAQAS